MNYHYFDDQETHHDESASTTYDYHIQCIRFMTNILLVTIISAHETEHLVVRFLITYTELQKRACTQKYSYITLPPFYKKEDLMHLYSVITMVWLFIVTISVCALSPVLLSHI